jgi:hypothetical protein
MRLGKELKKNLVLDMWSRIIIGIIVVLVPFISAADPVINNIVLSPGSFTFVEDKSILEDLGLAPGPAWCYDIQANATLITAPARERARCELELMYELEKQKTKYDFEIDKLKLRVETLTQQHEEILFIKNQEIEELTAAALKRPNDYTHWWAIGGFSVGVLTTVLTVLVVQGDL